MARRVVLASLVAVLVAVAVGFRSGPTGRPTNASIGAALDQIWTKYSSQLVGLCVGAVDDRVSITKCFGKKGPGAAARPNGDTLFRIESVSKTFTATLLALRVQQGKVKLGDPVSMYVPALGGRLLYPPSLTMEELADHYSGLPKSAPTAGSSDVFLLKTGACLAKRSCRHAVPGQSYLYSNWAFAALGNILALNDGFSDGTVGPWEEDNYKTIALPLGMKSTRSWPDWVLSDPAYFATHQAVSTTGQTHTDKSPYGDPGGGLYSSPRDMLRWLRYSMGLDGPTNLLAAHDLLYDHANLSTDHAQETIGLAWEVNTSTGSSCVWKGGDGLGFHSYVLFVKGQKRGIFVLLNSDPQTGKATIAKDLLNSLPATPGAGSPTC
jgi:CubicO group peptidase (beta-lactamase class C family)